MFFPGLYSKQNYFQDDKTGNLFLSISDFCFPGRRQIYLCALFWNNQQILSSCLYSLGRFFRAGYHHKWRTRCVIYWEYSPTFYRNRISIECKRVHPNMYLLISTYMQPHIYVPTYIYLHATPRPPSCMKSKIFPIPLECCGGVGECPRISPFLAQAQMVPAAWPTHAFIKIMKTFIKYIFILSWCWLIASGRKRCCIFPLLPVPCVYVYNGGQQRVLGEIICSQVHLLQRCKRIHFLKSLRPPIQLDRDWFRKTGRQRRQIDHPDLFPQNANSKAKVGLEITIYFTHISIQIA